MLFRATIFFAIVFGISHTMLAQDHLVPTDNYYSSYTYQHTYYSFMRTKLLTGLSDSPAAQAVVMPSFGPEYVVWVGKVDGEYQLVVRTLLNSVWSVHEKGEKAVEALQLIESRKPVSQKLGQQLNELFFEAVSQTHYPKRTYAVLPDGRKLEEFSIGVDGTTYSFSAFRAGHGNRTGEIWSPKAGTPMDELVKLNEQMKSLAQGEGAEANLLQRATALYGKIAKE